MPHLTEIEISTLESNLDYFEVTRRRESLIKLIDLDNAKDIIAAPGSEIINLHCHSFFSYNGYGYSPSHLAWIAKKHGIAFLGIVDFDVLDGVEEFFDACEMVGVKASAGMETRVFIPELADIEINSVGEPGVAYHLGVGFISGVAPSTAKRILDDIRSRAENRNQQMVWWLNDFLDPLRIDYQKDVLPATPSGNVTERHIIKTIYEKAKTHFENPTAFWSDKFGLDFEYVARICEDSESIQNFLRKKLMKQGGAGYVQPTRDTFPLIDDFQQVVEACGAIPCAAWLDGTTPGEKNISHLLDVLLSKGTAAINIVPERNWNISEPDERAKKTKNLYQIIKIAQENHLPVLAGTEMNSYGQKLYDDLNVPDLRPIRDAVISGAWFIYGHTRMQQLFGLGYQSGWAKVNLPGRQERNAFFINAGHLLPPSIKMQNIPEETNIINRSPKEILNFLARR
jgi:hypothetical protein